MSVYRRRTHSPDTSAGTPQSDSAIHGLTSGWTGNSCRGWKLPRRSPGRRANRMRQYINSLCTVYLEILKFKMIWMNTCVFIKSSYGSGTFYFYIQLVMKLVYFQKLISFYFKAKRVKRRNHQNREAPDCQSSQWWNSPPAKKTPLNVSRTAKCPNLGKYYVQQNVQILVL